MLHSSPTGPKKANPKRRRQTNKKTKPQCRKRTPKRRGPGFADAVVNAGYGLGKVLS